MDVLKRVPVKEQEPQVRAANFEEVCLGYSKEEAMEEAARCLNCKKLHVAAPSFIMPKKHYEATVIVEAKAGKVDFCPADNSTIRRWRR